MSKRLALLLASLVLLACIGGGAWLYHSAFSDGEQAGRSAGSVEVATLKREHAEHMARNEKEARERLEVMTTRLQTNQHALNEMAGQLATSQREYREKTERLTGELARVTTQYRRSLDAAPEPLPACVFTRDFVRLYDEATGAYPLPATGDPLRALAQAASSAAAWELDSGLGQRELLTHHIRYAEQCNATAVQLNKLIDAVETLYATRD